CMNETRSAIEATKSRSCSTTRNVPRSIAPSSSARRPRSLRGMPAVGSSSTITDGRCSSTICSSTHCFQPWLSCSPGTSPISSNWTRRWSRPAPGAASRSCSRTVSRGKVRGIWNLRPSPRRARTCGGPVSVSPLSATCPSCAVTWPVMTLASVVLPAPLGPISTWISPARRSSETSSRTTVGPNATQTPAHVSVPPSRCGRDARRGRATSSWDTAGTGTGTVTLIGSYLREDVVADGADLVAGPRAVGEAPALLGRRQQPGLRAALGRRRAPADPRAAHRLRERIDLHDGRLVRPLDERGDADLQDVAVRHRVAHVDVPAEHDRRGARRAEQFQQQAAVEQLAWERQSGGGKPRGVRHEREVADEDGRARLAVDRSQPAVAGPAVLGVDADGTERHELLAGERVRAPPAGAHGGMGGDEVAIAQHVVVALDDRERDRRDVQQAFERGRARRLVAV